MKTKLLKLALCALATLPIGAWGQTLDFSDYSDKTSVGDAKDLTVQSENFKIHFYCGKAKVKEQELYYATSGASTIEKSFTYVYQSGGTIAQTSEESDRSVAMYIPCDGKLTIYARRNTTETTVKVIQNSSEISNTTLNGENEGAGTIGGKTCYKPITVDVVAGMAYVTSTYEINFSGFKFEANAPAASSSTRWDFAGLTVDASAFDATDATISQETESGNKLYIHVKQGRKAAVEAVASTQTSFTLSNGVVCEMSKKITIYTTEVSSMEGAMSEVRRANNTMDLDHFAYDVTGPGTLYVIARFADAPTNHKMYIFFQRAANDYTSYSSAAVSDKNLFQVTATADAAGTFLIFAPGKKYSIQTIIWVPATTVNISEAKTATFSAPTNMKIPSGVSAYTVSDCDEEANVVTLKKLNSVIRANTGVVLISDEATNYYFTETADDEEPGTNYMVANTVGTIVLPTDGNGKYNYTLAYDGAPVFKHVSDSGTDAERTLAAGKAFLRTTVNVTGGGSRSINLVFDEDETTGISTVKVQNEEVTNGEYYDLMGRRIANPTKGLYIVNGKKVFIK